MPIFDALRAAIRASGHSQTAIARATDVDAGRISRFMRRERGLSVEAVEQIAAFLDFDVVMRCRKQQKQTKKRG